MFIHLSALLAIMTAALVQVPVTAAAPNALAVRGGYDCDSGQSSYCCDGGFDENGYGFDCSRFEYASESSSCSGGGSPVCCYDATFGESDGGVSCY